MKFKGTDWLLCSSSLPPVWELKARWRGKRWKSSSAIHGWSMACNGRTSRRKSDGYAINGIFSWWENWHGASSSQRAMNRSDWLTGSAEAIGLWNSKAGTMHLLVDLLTIDCVKDENAFPCWTGPSTLKREFGIITAVAAQSIKWPANDALLGILNVQQV